MSNRFKKIPTVKKKPFVPAPIPDYDWAKPAEVGKGKGEKDGLCNRTACQVPLKGREQWFMDGNFTGGPRLYYCERCAAQFTATDIQFREPIRCKLDQTTVGGR